MKIGFCTHYSEERIKFAQEAGFDAVEIGVGAERPLDPATVTDDELKAVKEVLDRHGIMATVLHGENYADPDPAVAEKAQKNFARAVAISEVFGTKIVSLNAWVPRDASLEEKLSFYKKVFGGFAKIAEDHGVKIAIENCPHGLANIAYTPAMWERIFDLVPSKAIGLEFDPSHLVWLHVDYWKALREFADRVYCFHAKDTEVFPEILERDGIYERTWWRFRMPGRGVVNWQKVMGFLQDIGYQGPVHIEHEDPVYHGDRFEEGLRIGLKYLRQVCG